MAGLRRKRDQIQEPDMLDLLIKGGMVVDGSGAKRFAADVGISGVRIVSVGRVSDPATRVIDADGLVVAPGLLDRHHHHAARDPASAPGSRWPPAPARGPRETPPPASGTRAASPTSKTSPRPP